MSMKFDEGPNDKAKYQGYEYSINENNDLKYFFPNIAPDYPCGVEGVQEYSQLKDDFRLRSMKDLSEEKKQEIKKEVDQIIEQKLKIQLDVFTRYCRDVLKGARLAVCDAKRITENSVQEEYMKIIPIPKKEAEPDPEKEYFVKKVLGIKELLDDKMIENLKTLSRKKKFKERLEKFVAKDLALTKRGKPPIDNRIQKDIALRLMNDYGFTIEIAADVTGLCRSTVGRVAKEKGIKRSNNNYCKYGRKKHE